MRTQAPSNPSLTDQLCTQCGLCCDGSLLADVELTGREAVRLEAMGLVMDDDDDQQRLPQPCAALKGTRCSIYQHRPSCCRTFACRLLLDAERGAVTVANARAQIKATFKHINRAKLLLNELGDHQDTLPIRERCKTVLSRPASDTRPRHKLIALETTLTKMEHLIETTFFDATSEM